MPASGDPSSLPDWISAIGNALLGIAAVLGFWQWQVQLRGDARFKAEKNFLQITFKFGDFFRVVRSYPDRVSIPLGETRVSEAIRTANLDEHHRRMKFLNDVMLELESSADELRLFDREHVDGFMRSIRSAHVQVEQLLIDLTQVSRSIRADSDEEREIRRHLFQRGDTPDSLATLLGAAISAVDARYGPRVRGRDRFRVSPMLRWLWHRLTASWNWMVRSILRLWRRAWSDRSAAD